MEVGYHREEVLAEHLRAERQGEATEVAEVDLLRHRGRRELLAVVELEQLRAGVAFTATCRNSPRDRQEACVHMTMR